MGTTYLERAIRSQPDELERLVKLDVGPAAAHLRDRQRIWLVGTGTSQHAAELGALLLSDAGIDARCSGSFEFARLVSGLGPRDAVIVISQSGRTAFANAAREAALQSKAKVLSITGIGSHWPEAIETVEMERSETYTVSYTAALFVLCRLADALGASAVSSGDLRRVAERSRTVASSAGHPNIKAPERALVLVGNGASAITAREGALKLREAAQILAEGYGGEYLLHGGAVPLKPGDSLVLIDPAADPDGLLTALGEAASAEGIAVAQIAEPSISHPILAQIPLTIALQKLALHFAEARSTDSDRAIVGGWADKALWAIGHPGKA